MEASRKPFYQYSLFINGLYGRNRKPRHQTFELTGDCEEQLSDSHVLTLAEEKIKELRPKSHFTIQVSEWPGEVVDYGNGVVMKSVRLGSRRLIKSEARVLS